MSLSIEVIGELSINPPLNKQEIEYLKKFSNMRRCELNGGEYSTSKSITATYDDPSNLPHDEKYNKVIKGQPSLWCQWVPTDDGKHIIFNNDSSDQNSGEWLPYLIEHFIGNKPLAKTKKPEEFSFLEGHKCNGTITTHLISHEFVNTLYVKNNKILDNDPNISKFQALISSFKDKWGKFTHNLEENTQHKQQLKMEENHEEFVNWLKAGVTKRFFLSLIKSNNINPDAKFTFRGVVGQYANGGQVFVNEDSVTILMIAAILANRQGIEALIESGADTSLTNSNGLTAHDLLRTKVHQSKEEQEYIESILTPVKTNKKLTP